VHPFFAAPRPRLFAHRGASGAAPENTLAAFALALSQGAGYLETDARLTRDGEVVLLHDATLERTTDGEGPLASRTFAELSRLDAGHRFSTDGGQHFPFRASGLRVPRLAELLAGFPAARVNLEIKGDDPACVDPVLEVVRQARAGARVLLTAEDSGVLGRIVAREPGTAIGSSSEDVVALIRAHVEARLERFRPRGQALQVPVSFMGQPLVTPELIGAAHRVGLELHVWTVNEPGQMARLLTLGVDGLISDFPDRLVRALAGRR
jgi:glycerophosphoryl diester phosphodiesterase